ncbi:alkaline phosphatase family protein [Nonomuraea typhae]|uniref:alkaline phosphatase family protein n=1 Tax=Nonomuraea typhae TaxID=2603600 RepID=UPI0012F8863F|nr:alkaline phosphatase family protein [Nonomuraea typhae]
MSISRRTVLGGMAAVGAAAATGVAEAAAWAGGPRRAKHVIVVDWDGFDPSYLGRVATPQLDRLAARGTLAVAEGTFHTVSNPCRASMSTGAYPEVHGNVAYVFDPVSGRAQGQSRFLAAQTIAEALAAEGRTVASVQWYMIQNHGVRYGDPEHLYVQPGGGFGQRVDVAIDILNLRPVLSDGQWVTVPKVPDLLAVYSSDLDGLGHAEGPDSPGMAALLAAHDRQLGRLVQATKDVGIYPDTAFLLTSDHGMTAWNRSVLPHVVEAVEATGHSVEIVPSGAAPDPGTEVVIVPNAVRVGDITLRGPASGPRARVRIRAALQRLPQIGRVLDDRALRSLHAGDKLGDLVAEAKPPWGFGYPEPPAGEWRGAHGSLREMKVPLLLSGAGVRPGLRLRRPRLIDVAPTIAALLGARPPAHAQGRDLTGNAGFPLT